MPRYLIRATFLFILFMATSFSVTADHANAEMKEYCLTAMPSIVNSKEQRPITGYVSLADMELLDNHTLGTGNDQKVYFAEGTPITIDDSQLSNGSSDVVTFDSPWFPGTPVRIDRSFLVPAEAYQRTYEPPKMTIHYRETMFASPWNNDQHVVAVLKPGEEAEIIAVIAGEFLVNVRGTYGFIRQDAGPFRKSGYTYAGTFDSGRVYDLRLVYYEPFFESAEKAGADERSVEDLDEEEAVARALEYAKEHSYYEKYLSEGYRLNTYARLNYAHRNSALGLTWQVIVYGDFQKGIPIEAAFFVDFDDPNTTALLLPDDFVRTVPVTTLDQMTDEHWQMLRDRLGEDIRARYIYYFFEISVTTGEVVMDEVFIDTPYSQIALF